MKRILSLLTAFLVISSPVFAAICEDGFTGEIADVELSLHTPDTTGTSWTKIRGRSNGSANLGTASDIKIDFAGARLDGGASTCSGGDGAIYTCQGTYPTANYSVSAVGNFNNADDPNWLACRVIDINNMYVVRIDNGGTQIYILENDVLTAQGSEQAGMDDGSTAILYCGDAADNEIRVTDDGVEVHKITDSTHTGTGEGGMGFGELSTGTEDCASGERWYNALITDLGANGAPPAERRVIFISMKN